MHRFFVSPQQIRDQWIYIEDEQARHIRLVLRLKAGALIGVFDGLGQEYLARLEKKEGKTLVARVLSVVERGSEAALRLHLVQSLPRGDKMDFVVQKAVEMGLASIFPVLGERSTVRLDKDRAERKVQRWQAVAREACKQCGRALIPQVYPVQPLDKWLADCGQRTAIMLYEENRDRGLKQVLREDRHKWSGEIYLLIGPEGGFSPGEVEKARQAGVILAGLGPRILRTETAGLVAATLILYEFGELGG